MKKRLVVCILLSFVLTFFITKTLISNLSNGITEYVSSVVKKQNILLLKDSFAKSGISNIEVDDLITVIKNSKEEIAEVDFDMQKSTILLSKITDYINLTLTEYNYTGYRVDIPVGIFRNNPILVNIGPKIPVKVELSDVALGNVRTSVKPFGINSALVEVYLDIFIRASILYPFQIIDATSEYSSLVASKIISGTVPNFWGGAINSKSDTINLPLGE